MGAVICTWLEILITFVMITTQPRYGAGVDPVLTSYEDPPFCPHGPTLLFKRYYSSTKEPREFYACAVYRDRKGCSFFHWKDEKISQEKRERWEKAFADNQPTPVDSRRSMDTIRALPVSERHYCPQCGVLLVKEDLPSHEGHSVVPNITDTQLDTPTTLLTPIDDRKSQAQFLFSGESLDFLHDALKRLKYDRVLCIGTPRLHELLSKENDVKSLLLDIDHRYVQFYTPEQYQRYNMFNHYFYSSDGLATCQSFLAESADNTAIVIDPPFGGLAEVLAVSIKKLWEISDKELPTFLVFPYYLESHVIRALPSLWMMDYQVTYLNHKHFSATRRKPKPSPVRIFTNLALPGLVLPSEEGYHLCQTCNRYVARLNSHCDKCGTCTSKDGQVYTHCDVCKRCVKQSWVHCRVCGRCEQSQHRCGSRSKIGCHKCGSLEHKRRDCTELEISVLPDSSPPRKKRRTRTCNTQKSLSKCKK